MIPFHTSLKEVAISDMAGNVMTSPQMRGLPECGDEAACMGGFRRTVFLQCSTSSVCHCFLLDYKWWEGIGAGRNGISGNQT